MNDDSRNNDDRIRRPFTVGARYAAAAIGLFAVAAAGRAVHYRELLPGADWYAIAAIPVGLAAVCFGYAYLGAAIGAKRAQVATAAVLMAVLLLGTYALTRYLDGTHR